MQIFPMYKVVEKEKRKLGNILGGYLVTPYAQGPQDLADLQFSFLNGEDLVNVVYTCLAHDLERLRPQFEESLSTLRRDTTRAP